MTPNASTHPKLQSHMIPPHPSNPNIPTHFQHQQYNGVNPTPHEGIPPSQHFQHYPMQYPQQYQSEYPQHAGYEYSGNTSQMEQRWNGYDAQQYSDQQYYPQQHQVPQQHYQPQMHYGVNQYGRNFTGTPQKHWDREGVPPSGAIDTRQQQDIMNRSPREGSQQEQLTSDPQERGQVPHNQHQQYPMHRGHPHGMHHQRGGMSNRGQRQMAPQHQRVANHSPHEYPQNRSSHTSENGSDDGSRDHSQERQTPSPSHQQMHQRSGPPQNLQRPYHHPYGPPQHYPNQSQQYPRGNFPPQPPHQSPIQNQHPSTHAPYPPQYPQQRMPFPPHQPNGRVPPHTQQSTSSANSSPHSGNLNKTPPPQPSMAQPQHQHIPPHQPYFPSQPVPYHQPPQYPAYYPHHPNMPLPYYVQQQQSMADDFDLPDLPTTVPKSAVQQQVEQIPRVPPQTTDTIEKEDEISDFEDDFGDAQFEEAPSVNGSSLQSTVQQQASRPSHVLSNSFDDFLLGGQPTPKEQTNQPAVPPTSTTTNQEDDFFDLGNSAGISEIQKQTDDWMDEPTQQLSNGNDQMDFDVSAPSPSNNTSTQQTIPSTDIPQEEEVFDEDEDEEEWGDFEEATTPAPRVLPRKVSTQQIDNQTPIEEPKPAPAIKDRQSFVDDLFSFDTVEVPVGPAPVGVSIVPTDVGVAVHSEVDPVVPPVVEDAPSEAAEKDAQFEDQHFSDDEEEEWGDFEENPAVEEEPATDNTVVEEVVIVQDIGEPLPDLSTSTSPSNVSTTTNTDVNSKKSILDLFTFEEEPVVQTIPSSASQLGITIQQAPTEQETFEAEFDEDTEEEEWGEFVEAPKEAISVETTAEETFDDEFDSADEQPAQVASETISDFHSHLQQLLEMQRFAEAAECFTHMQQNRSTNPSPSVSWFNLSHGYIPSKHTHKFLEFFMDDRVFAHIDQLHQSVESKMISSADDVQSAEELKELHTKLERYENEALKMMEIYAPTVRLLYACFKELCQCQDIHYRMTQLAPAQRDELFLEKRVQRYFENIIEVDWVLQQALQSIIAECGTAVGSATVHLQQMLETMHQDIKGGAFSQWNLDWKTPFKETPKNATTCVLTEFVHTDMDQFCVYGGQQVWWKAANMWHARVNVKPPKRIKR